MDETVLKKSTISKKDSCSNEEQRVFMLKKSKKRILQTLFLVTLFCF